MPEEKNLDKGKNCDKNNDEEQKKNIRRPFATGSKPGPDEIDHYLESKGLYRKHIARDASSLFRVVSEQVFDIQNYHDKVRQDCASFIEQNFKEYVQEVDKNIYNYCTQLRRNRTHGTLFDLKVMARMYKKNVLLYEPTKNYQTIERYYVKNDDYDNKSLMRVFYSEQDKHFDIVFTLEYTEQLADSQGVVYEILYKDVFKLPDVCYAVERMLHDPEGVTTIILEENPSKYMNATGEIISFDSPDKTNCVLKDPRTCHYHNQEDFEEVLEEHKDLVTVINRSDEPGRLKIYKPIDGFLHDQCKSCVRQLLDEKITPFPYKVAKALDRSIYRNTEFELWSENRKDQRLKWLDSNGLPIREPEDMYGNICEKKTTHTKITLNALDEILRGNAYEGKKRPFFYSIDELSDLNDNKIPFQFDTVACFPTHFNNSNYKKFNYQGRRRGGGTNYGNNRYEYHHNHNFGAEMNRDNFFHEQDPQAQQNFVDTYQYMPYEQFSPTAFHNQPGTHFYMQPAPYPVSYAVHPQAPANFVPNISFTAPPPQIQAIIPTPVQNSTSSFDSLNLIRENELSSNVNQTSQESVDPRANDLPLTDLPTLQFFYNLGIRYFSVGNSSVRNRLEVVANQLENLNINDSNRNELKTDAIPPPPANTPVSSKPQQGHLQQQGSNSSKYGGHSNNRFQNGNHIRRTYSNQNRENNYRENQNRDNRDSNWRDNRNRHTGSNGNPRKESGIQFNSNVKNLHKIESDTKSLSTSVQQQNSTGNADPQNNAQASGQLSTQQQQQQLVIQVPSPNSNVIPATSGISPILSAPIDANNTYEHVQGQWPQQSQVAVQSYCPFPGGPNIIPQPAPTVTYCYNENGELVPYQAQTPQQQQIFYGYPQTTPIYYQPTQNSMNHFYDDSGHADSSVHSYSAYPVYYAQPPPVYYPPTPASATHVMATPVFPVIQNNSQHNGVMSTTPVIVTPMTENNSDEIPESDQKNEGNGESNNVDNQNTDAAPKLN
ncbi:hypothetical protein PVAND_013088 [Polypedilum vanderplanki]|uniref:OTU domain-containing protein n=1 Tax=Polypedilum vanderplanki TaxID=319348 RepID=A0A9J6CNK8_POLVA|nr:hypothetical protein PVAND_013088 [Polypedilum vanderplanki]